MLVKRVWKENTQLKQILEHIKMFFSKIVYS
jgi:hypothetical protein